MISKQNTAKFSPGVGSGGAGGKALAIEGSAPSPLTAHRRGLDGEFAGDMAGRARPESAPEDLGLHAIWAVVRADMRRDVGEARFDNWFAGLELIAELNGEVLVAAPSELERNRVLQGVNGHTIQQGWNRVDPRRRIVTIEARANIAPDVLALAEPMPAIEIEEDVAADALPVVRKPDEIDGPLTLDNFLVGESNRIAFGLARRLATGASVAANVVTLFGPHGVGKTHLMRGIQAMLVAARGPSSVVYTSAEDFMLAYVDGVKRKDTSEMRATFRKARVVLLDDFQFICSKPGTLTEFFAHLRAVVANGGVVVLACDRAPSSFEQLDERMRDEIQGGVVAKMELPERSLRREIIRAKADEVSRLEKCDFTLQDEWVDLLADKLPSSGRILDGAVRNIYVGTVMDNLPITRAAVDKAVQLAHGANGATRPKIDTIKDVTAKAYGVTKIDLESPCRKRQFAQPRQYAMYMCRQLTTCSYPQIGRMFGDRDHTTVLFAFRKISRLVEANPQLADELRQLEQKILADPRNSR
jgi:chromosomal replication initiator protein